MSVEISDKVSDVGINPEEPFDVTPYAHALAHCFLRNPICQDIGRKFRITFASDERGSAYTCFHNIGFIPKLENEQRGFKVAVGGKRAGQYCHTQDAIDELPANRGLIRDRLRGDFAFKVKKLNQITSGLVSKDKALPEKNTHVMIGVLFRHTIFKSNERSYCKRTGQPESIRSRFPTY